MAYAADVAAGIPPAPCGLDGEPSVRVRIPVMGDAARLAPAPEPTVYAEPPVLQFGNKAAFNSIHITKDRPAPELPGSRGDAVAIGMNAKWTRDNLRRAGALFGLNAYLEGAGVNGQARNPEQELPISPEQTYVMMQQLMRRNLPRSGAPSFEARTDAALSRAGRTGGAGAALPASADGFSVPLQRTNMYVADANPWMTARGGGTGTFVVQTLPDRDVALEYKKYTEDRPDGARGMWHDPTQIVRNTARDWADSSMTAGYGTGVRSGVAVPDLPGLAPAAAAAVEGRAWTGVTRATAVPDVLPLAPASGTALGGRAWTGVRDPHAVPDVLPLAPASGTAVTGRAWTGVRDPHAVADLPELAAAAGATRRNAPLTHGVIGAGGAPGVASGWAQLAQLDNPGFRGHPIYRQSDAWVGTVPGEHTDDWAALQAVTGRNAPLHDMMLRKGGTAIAAWDFGEPVARPAEAGKEWVMMDGATHVLPEMPRGSGPLLAGEARFDRPFLDPRLYANEVGASAVTDATRMSAPGQFLG